MKDNFKIALRQFSYYRKLVKKSFARLAHFGIKSTRPIFYVTRLLEHFKISFDERGIAGAVLMDLSKAFDCIRYDHLIAEVHANGFSYEA